MLPWSMPPPDAPTYPLADMQEKVACGHYQLLQGARDGAARLDLDEEDVKECICGLTAEDFYKTMPSENENVPGDFQDVYKTEFYGRLIYTKLSMNPKCGRKTVVVSFKSDEGAQAGAEENQ